MAVAVANVRGATGLSLGRTFGDLTCALEVGLKNGKVFCCSQRAVGARSLTNEGREGGRRGFCLQTRPLLAMQRTISLQVLRAIAMEDSLADIDGAPGSETRDYRPDIDDEPASEPREYPPGMNRYETMVVLRPDMTEDERLNLTERYEEAMVAGGALDVEMFNRGMQPLAYNIRKKNMGGFANRYLDGIYLLFTYVTKPESQVTLQKKLNKDDDVIRSTTFKLRI